MGLAFEDDLYIQARMVLEMVVIMGVRVRRQRPWTVQSRAGGAAIGARAAHLSVFPAYKMCQARSMNLNADAEKDHSEKESEFEGRPTAAS